MFCHECGRRFLEYHNFCSYCGVDLKDEKGNYSEEHDNITARLNNLTSEELESLFDDKASELISMDINSAEYWNIKVELKEILEVLDDKIVTDLLKIRELI